MNRKNQETYRKTSDWQKVERKHATAIFWLSSWAIASDPKRNTDPVQVIHWG